MSTVLWRSPVPIPDEIKQLVLKGYKKGKEPITCRRGFNRAGDGEGEKRDGGFGERCL